MENPESIDLCERTIKNPEFQHLEMQSCPRSKDRGTVCCDVALLLRRVPNEFEERLKNVNPKDVQKEVDDC